MLPDEIQRKMEGLAARLRRLQVLGGAGWTALGLSAGVLLSFGADYTFRLPLGMRIFTLAVLLALIVTLGVRYLWLPLRRRPTLDETALQVEARFPDLRDGLISAVQLSRQMESDEFYQSRELAGSVVQAGGEAIRDLDLRRAAPAGNTMRVFGSSVAALAVLALLGAASPYHARTWFERICLLRDVEWQKSVVLAVEVPPGGFSMAQGDDLTVRVRVLKGRPDEVLMHSRLKSHDRWESRPMVLHRRDDGDTYDRTFREVPEAFRFYVTGGDARTERYGVEVKIPPSIQEIALEVTYPEYLNLPGRTIPDGSVSAPVGSRVRVAADASRPLSEAAIVMGSAERRPLEPTSGDRGARTHLESAFVVDHTLWYRFDLVDDEGFRNSRPIRYRVEALPDRPPGAEILTPGRNSNVTARALIPMEIEVSDDNGIRSARLVYRVLSGYDDRGEDQGVPLADIQPGVVTARTTLPFDLANLSLKLGDRVEYLVEAEDYREHQGPNVGRSSVYVFTVVSENEIQANLEARLQKIRDDVKQTVRTQRIGQELTLAAFGEDADTEEVIRGRLVQAELSQKKISQSIARIGRQLQGIGLDMDWNRVGDEKERAWIGDLTTLIEEGAGSRSEAVADLLGRARREKDLTLAEGIPTVQDEIIQVLDRVWSDLDRWADFREMIRRIREIRDEQEWIRRVLEGARQG